jgi:CRISPR system Cascade subunit CasD
MSTLLIRLAAPLQAWGVDAKFDRRLTERVPTKSGILGLAAAALGRRRNESLEDLQALRFGVRVDRDGVLMRDYHTAKSVKAAYVTNRYYLSDAVFLAGLEGDGILLEEIEHALQHPVFPLFLGRRSCPPEGRLSLGIRSGKTLYEALKEEPRLVGDFQRSREAPVIKLRILMDAEEDDQDAFFQRDIPVTFNQTHRKFGFRRVSAYAPVVVFNPNGRRMASEPTTEHDPMPELEG